MHNSNMDLILTLLRYSVYYNNTIKLIIMSATMDSDEPYYRRYYRDINDNKMYPFNYLLTKHNLDRITVDRRFHIESMNKFDIIERYRPNQNPIEIIKEILKISDNGDILLFQTGEMTIKKMVIELNKITPNYILTLPYYRKLPSDKLKILQNFNDYRNCIIIPKNENFDTYTGKLYGKNTVYKRYIIVATDIIEASVTIKTLKFVIDNGVRNSVIYDYKIFVDINDPNTEITDQSRLQRRGRIGRVDSGTVYYMYNENQKNIINNYIIYQHRIFIMIF